MTVLKRIVQGAIYFTQGYLSIPQVPPFVPFIAFLPQIIEGGFWGQGCMQS